MKFELKHWAVLPELKIAVRRVLTVVMGEHMLENNPRPPKGRDVRSIFTLRKINNLHLLDGKATR